MNFAGGGGGEEDNLVLLSNVASFNMFEKEYLIKIFMKNYTMIKIHYIYI